MSWACTCCVCSWGALCTDFPGSLALAFGHVHTLDVVCVCVIIIIKYIWWTYFLCYHYRGLTDMRCIIFVQKVITAIVLRDLLNTLLPKYNSWKTKFIAGKKFGLQNQSRKKQNEIVEEFQMGLVCRFLKIHYCNNQI